MRVLFHGSVTTGAKRFAAIALREAGKPLTRDATRARFRCPQSRGVPEDVMREITLQEAAHVEGGLIPPQLVWAAWDLSGEFIAGFIEGYQDA